jgi:S1-C subfamily serine protease
MKAQHRIFLSGLIGLFVFSLSTWAAVVPDTLKTAAKSVVRINVHSPDGTEVVGTGFVCKDKSYVVTTLHLVVGMPHVTVWYESYGKRQPARLFKKLERSDLALLQVDSPPDVIPLVVSDGAVAPGDALIILGYPLGVPSLSSTDGKIREIGGKRLKDIIPYDIRTNIENFGFPSVDAPVVDLEAPLVPGHSGSPVLRQDGDVVAIGDGGLERGSGSRGWAIPVSELQDLFSAAEVDDNTISEERLHNVRELYGAELKAKVGDTVTLHDSGIRLTKVRSRSFAELSVHADDLMGLNQLVQALRAQHPEIDPSQFQYDIYQDADSGATIVVPAGAKLKPEGDHFIVERANNTLKMLIRLYHGSSPQDAVFKSNEMLPLLVNDDPMVQWGPDPTWSQLAPVWHPGFSIRRTSWVVARFGPNPYNGFGAYTVQYAFAVVGIRDSTMLGTIAINKSFMDQSHVRDWAQMHMGIQLTTFSQAYSPNSTEDSSDHQ